MIANLQLDLMNIYSHSQNTGRVYKTDTCLIEIPNFLLDKIEQWNKTANSSVEIDEKMALALLMALVTVEQIEENHVSQEVISIIQGKYFINKIF